MLNVSATFSGVIRRRWRPVTGDARCDISLVLSANHVTVTNQQRSSVLVTQTMVSQNRI